MGSAAFAGKTISGAIAKMAREGGGYKAKQSAKKDIKQDGKKGILIGHVVNLI